MALQVFGHTYLVRPVYLEESHAKVGSREPPHPTGVVLASLTVLNAAYSPSGSVTAGLPVIRLLPGQAGPCSAKPVHSLMAGHRSAALSRFLVLAIHRHADAEHASHLSHRNTQALPLVKQAIAVQDVRALE